MRFQELNISQFPRDSKACAWLEVGSRADGGDWRLPFLYVIGATPGPTLLVLGAVHGDEYEGVETIPEVFHRIAPDTLRGALLMVPICNIPAYGGCPPQ